MARNTAILITADLHPTGGPEIWSRNQISPSLSTRIPIHTDADGCPLNTQPYLYPTLVLQKMTPLWEHGFHDWAQIPGRAPDGRLYFLENRELIWANHTTARLVGDSSFQENVPFDAAGPAASNICLFTSPFLRKIGGDGDCLHTDCNFGAWYSFSDFLDTFPQKNTLKNKSRHSS